MFSDANGFTKKPPYSLEYDSRLVILPNPIRLAANSSLYWWLFLLIFSLFSITLYLNFLGSSSPALSLHISVLFSQPFLASGVVWLGGGQISVAFCSKTVHENILLSHNALLLRPNESSSAVLLCECSLQHSTQCNYNSFEFHAITVTAPIKLQVVVIYRPPGQIPDTFLEELDGLLSSFLEDGSPLLVFGDFYIHLDKPYATDFTINFLLHLISNDLLQAHTNQATNLT